MSPSRIVSAVLTVVLALMPAFPAHALMPVSRVHAEPGSGELQENLDRYRRLAEDLSVTRAQTEIMQRQIADLQAQMAGKRAAIGRVADAAYRGYRVDPLTVLASSTSSEEVLRRMAMINAYAERRQQEIDALEVTRARFEAVQRTLESLIEQQRSQQQALIALRLRIQPNRR